MMFCFRGCSTMGKTCVRKELFCDGKVKAVCLKFHNFPKIFRKNILTLKVNCPFAADEENCYTLPKPTTTPRQVERQSLMLLSCAENLGKVHKFAWHIGSKKRRIFYGQAGSKGGRGSALFVLTVSKCENFDPLNTVFLDPKKNTIGDGGSTAL